MISPDDPRIQEIIDKAESKSEAINDLFDLGLTKGQIMKLGYVESTVRKEVNRRKERGQEVAGTPAKEPSVLPAITKGTEAVLPEYLSGEISEYFDGSLEQQRIFKAGIMVPLMGMRLFAEMVKPLTMLINAMKGDQVEATMKAMALGQQQAHDAAMEASSMTAAQVGALMKESAAASAVAGSKDPMKVMAAQQMQPLFTQMMNLLMSRVMPGLGGQTPDQLPANWTRRSE